MDQFGSQIRHFRPISVDKTEVTIYCIAPKGESRTARAARIRQYEDFFNATGMATPDDLEEFRSCQKTYQAGAAPFNDLSRGVTHQLQGPDEDAKKIGINPISSGVKTEDEGLYPIQHATGYKRSPRRSTPTLPRTTAEGDEKHDRSSRKHCHPARHRAVPLP